MSKTTYREEEIPRVWRVTVIRILDSDDFQSIQRTETADKDWRTECPNAWLYHRHAAMANALRNDGVTGRHITDMEPQCDTYEFWFYYDERKFLGKIGLLPNGKIIIIFSSHLPIKGDTL